MKESPSHSATGITGAPAQSGTLFGPLRSAFSGRTLNHSPIDNLVLAELTVLDTLVGYRNIFAKLKYNNQLTLVR
jgi:hypothetical protein